MTTQSGKDAGTGGGGKDAPIVVDADDLDLIDNDLEDDGKSDKEIWNELDAAEGEKAAGDEGADKAATKDDDAGTDAAADNEEAVEDEPDKSAAAAADKGDQHAKDGDGGAPDKEAAQAAEPTLEELKKERDRLVEQNRRLEQADRSNRGRVSALQQKLDAQRGLGQPAQGGKKPANGAKKPFQSDKGKDFVKEYPEVAAPVAAELEEVRSELDDLKAERARREQAETDARLLKNEQVLDGKHPKWEQTAATAQFGDWVETQPNYVKAAVQRNFNAIVDAQEAVDIFDRFEAFRSSQAGGDQNTQRQGNGNGAQDGPDGKREQADGKNGSLSGKRQRQLESSSGARSTGPGLVDGVPEDGDYEATWKAMDREDERKERQARRA